MTMVAGPSGASEAAPVVRPSGRSLFGLEAPGVRGVVWAAYVVALAGLIAARLILHDAQAGLIVEETIWGAVGATTALVLTVAWYRSRGTEARVWAVIATATFLLLAGWTYYWSAGVTGPTADLRAVGPTIVSDVLASVLLVAMLVCLIRVGHASLYTRIAFRSDVVTVCAIAAGVLGFYVVGPWLRSMGPTPVFVLIPYSWSPVIGAVGVVGAGLVLSGTRTDGREPWQRLLALSLAFLGLGLVLVPVGYADNRWGIAGGWAVGLVDVLWLSGVFTVGTAAIYRQLGADRPWRMRPLAALEPSYGWIPSVVLPAIEVLSIPLMAVTATRESADGRVAALTLMGAVAVGFAAHTLLSAADGGTLEVSSAVDRLTGLGSARRFQEQLSSAIVAAVRYRQPVSVLSIQIDGFEAATSARGLASGDATLVGFAGSVERAIGPQNAAYRIREDEIGVILPDTGADAATHVAETILDEIRSATAGPESVTLAASAGIASFPEHALDPGELLNRARMASAWARSRGRDGVELFDSSVAASFEAVAQTRETAERADAETVRALLAAFYERDSAARAHSIAVSRNAVSLARGLGLTDREVTTVEYAALLHDIGKIGMSDAVVSGAAQLSASDERTVREHPLLGEQLLSSIHGREVLPLVRNHHERWDGTGYPDGLAGQRIPLGARIIALADAYDAMRRDGARGIALSRTAALQEIDLGLGSAFDPELGERFIGVVGRKRP